MITLMRSAAAAPSGRQLRLRSSDPAAWIQVREMAAAAALHAHSGSGRTAALRQAGAAMVWRLRWATSVALTSRQGQSEVFGPIRLKHSGRCPSCDRAWISGPGRPLVISKTSLSCWAAPALFRPEAREEKVPASLVPALDRSRHCHRAGAGLHGATLTWKSRQDVLSMLNTVRPVRQVCLRNRTQEMRWHRERRTSLLLA